ncbi:MAG: caspase family protein [Saprospiraceae bacterium]
MKKRLFALFTGINEYQRTDFLNTLSGAEPDARNLEGFIRGMGADMDFQPEMLLGRDATRSGIIEGILNHLGQAGSDDVALFYFSGHGLREKAPPAFEAANGTTAIEALACYDSYADADTFGLANKELRYLLHKAAKNKPHLVVITDCCHSATATRSGLMPVRRSGGPALYQMQPAREWRHFLFSGEISPDRPLSPQELEAQLPQARHLHLAACQAEQSAFEVGGEGVFTTHLLEVLRQSGGAVSYLQLRERTASLIRSRTRQYEQTPGVYAPKGSFMADEAFLGMEGRKNKVFVTVTVGEGDIRINRGLIHGLPSENEQEGIAISIFEQGRPEAGEVASAQVRNTGITSSEIRLVGDAGLKKDRLYEAYIEGLYQRDFNVALYGHAGEEAGRQLVRQAFRNVFQKDVAEAPGPNTDCVVVLHQNRIVLAHPDSDYLSLDEGKYLPLAKQLNGYTPENAAQAVRLLQHIAKYQVTRNIVNRNSALNPGHFPLKIQIGKNDYPTRPAPWNETEGCFDILLAETPTETQKATLFFTISNNAPQTLYFCPMYMSQRYGVYPNLFDETGMSFSVDPGKNREGKMSYVLESFIPEFNQPFEKGLLRLFVATEAFNLSGMKLDDLPAPERAAKRGEVEKGITMGIARSGKRADWIIVDYPVRILNPAYAKPE